MTTQQLHLHIHANIGINKVLTGCSRRADAQSEVLGNHSTNQIDKTFQHWQVCPTLSLPING